MKDRVLYKLETIFTATNYVYILNTASASVVGILTGLNKIVIPKLGKLINDTVTSHKLGVAF